MMRIETSDGQGNIVSVEESDEPPFPSLDKAAALATLLVVEGVIDLQDAANAVHEQPSALIHEAQAWAL